MKSKKKTTTPLLQAFVETTQIEGVKSLNSPVFPKDFRDFTKVIQMFPVMPFHEIQLINKTARPPIPPVFPLPE